MKMDQLYRPSPEFEELLDAMCDDTLSAEQSRRLEEIAVADDEAMLHYLCHVHLHGTLHWNIAQPAGRADALAKRRAPQLPSGPDIPLPPEPVSQPIVIDLNSPNVAQAGNFQSFMAGPAFSYTVASLVLCIMIFGASLYKISASKQFAETSPTGTSDNFSQIFVGRITGEDACLWADGQSAAIAGAYVPLDRIYALEAGLLEITYDSGAKVILEGPCEFRANSRSGGFLASGKLVARMQRDRGTRGGGLEVGKYSEGDPPSPPFPFIFSIATPSAIVTDLGTEFGVEVDGTGCCTAHVFEGRVEIEPRAKNRTGRAVELAAGQSARVGLDAESFAVSRTTADPKRFARRMPYRGSIVVHNTGVGLAHGDSDPNWEIIRAIGHADFTRQPAVVTAVSSRYYRRNIPERSQWISTGDMLPMLPEDATYTFRTTFDIGGLPSRSLVLRGGFAADNHVEAIRLNGVSIPVPEHEYTSPYQQLIPFTIADGFIEGANVLEFDVRNGNPKAEPYVSRMLLLVELETIAQSRTEVRRRPQTPQSPKGGGKESAR